MFPSRRINDFSFLSFGYIRLCQQYKTYLSLDIKCLILLSNFKLDLSRPMLMEILNLNVHTNLYNVSRETDLTKSKVVFVILRLRVKNCHAYRRRPTDKRKVTHRSLKTSSVFWEADSQFWSAFLQDLSERTMLCKLFLIVSATTLALQTASPHNAPTVHVQQGTLTGTYLTSRYGRKFAAFQGIPYAQPPTGDLRFKVRVVYFKISKGTAVFSNVKYTSMYPTQFSF